MVDVLDKLAEAVAEEESLESLVNSLLELLEAVTGLESTYLTHIDALRGVQHVVFSRNSKDLDIPAGLTVPWGDTLCKRALDEKRPFTDDVEACWGDSIAAKALGLKTYISEPVRIGHDELYGTLCGASKSQKAVSPKSRRLLVMFSRLIARQLERDRLLERLKQEHMTFKEYALTDPLTGIPNRRAMETELQRALANAERTGSVIHLAFIDLDDFKRINDQHGHDAGDRFLIEIAKTLKAGIREGDVVARIGGDEFVVFGNTGTADSAMAREVIAHRLTGLTRGTFDLGVIQLEYGGASVGVATSLMGERDIDALMGRADEAMYLAKQTRRTTSPAPSTRHSN
ncbi:sensor domain-containing diguanylate cyclase [Billgrantia kenyensis]|uniref:diguanylate cyclase n=1 Tax=Billgrantia kenyensis TaxID=321266 RepID=A0A7V9VYF1_9GAMM|nr:sensor domain-containing diguanylate cyclase [Halomonas kenyensis]MBA2777723.1 sensor domain-containing diguanylate cyclase [Halomonas kenyensis]MCG6660393.1 sensor domain-containing diguanylate cyclase [Halomonas kenyensis]